MNPGPVVKVLEALGVPFALVGGHAMAARGYPRFTTDLDLLTTERRMLDALVWTDLIRQGARVDARRGDADDPLAGVVHIELADASDIDVIVGRWPWEASLIGRAEPTPLMGLSLPVPRTSDLILLKLAAGGYLDRHDAASLLKVGDRLTLVSEVERHIDEVRPDIRLAWRDLLASVPAE